MTSHDLNFESVGNHLSTLTIVHLHNKQHPQERRRQHGILVLHVPILLVFQLVAKRSAVFKLAGRENSRVSFSNPVQGLYRVQGASGALNGAV